MPNLSKLRHPTAAPHARGDDGSLKNEARDNLFQSKEMQSSTGTKGQEANRKEKDDHVDIYGRKVWDVEYYTQRAAEKKKDGEEDDFSFLPETRKEKIFPPPHLRKPLQSRVASLNLEKELGKSRVITANTPKMHQGGYWCEVCECLIKDSQAYLDHINGKKHNRLLGMSMRVERVGADIIRNKLRQLHKKKVTSSEIDDEMDIQLRLKALKDKEEERRQRRKEKRRRKMESATQEVLDPNNASSLNEEKGIRSGFEAKRLTTAGKIKYGFAPDDAAEDEEAALRAAMGLPSGFTGQ